MSQSRGRLVPVLICAVLLLGAANLGAFAATGGPLVLGQNNTASKTTKVKTTGNGAALKLTSKAGKAPLAVSNKVKVKKLNADLVDGNDGAALRNRTYIFRLAASTITQDYVIFGLSGLPAGKYLANMNVSLAVDGVPSFVGCFIYTGTGLNISAPVVGLAGTSGAYFSNASGYVDTTTATYRVGCQRSGATSMTIPAIANFPAYVSFTRVDDVTSANRGGTGSAVPRQSPLG